MTLFTLGQRRTCRASHQRTAAAFPGQSETAAEASASCAVPSMNVSAGAHSRAHTQTCAHVYLVESQGHTEVAVAVHSTDDDNFDGDGFRDWAGGLI